MFRKKSDLEKLAERQESREFDAKYDDDAGGASTFVRERGVRETFESILIAIVLALLFRNFLGEAYIIPTGSMAPSLQGRHMDIECEKCGYEYRSGASIENNAGSGEVQKTACPICQHILELERNKRRDHRSFAGDRILVNKFIYDFQTPGRWDVIVFKYPNNGKQNYIKRCVGIAGEGLLIEMGDIYTYDLDNEKFEDRTIARKNHRKLRAMLQLVDDTDFIAPQMKEVGWPSRWQQWEGGDKAWDYEFLDEGMKFTNSGSSDKMHWLRYRHLRPHIDVEPYKVRSLTMMRVRDSEWEKIEIGSKPTRLDGYKGELITDHYAYAETLADRRLRDPDGVPVLLKDNSIGVNGMHWVGDLGIEAQFKLASTSGSIAFDVVEGGVHFTCTIDIGSGEATLTTTDQINVEFVDEGNKVANPPAAKTPITGPGTYNVRFVNADDRLYLWVNNTPIEFEASEYIRSGPVTPKWTEEDPLDAEPLGIGCDGVDMSIENIKVVRDVYYVSANREKGHTSISSEYLVGNEWNPQDVHELFRDPEAWDDNDAIDLFNSRQRNKDWVFELRKYPDQPEKDNFMPMGDNSPQSSDARVWPGPPHINREYLLGRAMYIYWPHAKTRPLPFWPNFEQMKLIR